MAVITFESEVDLSGEDLPMPYLGGDELQKEITIIGWGATGDATDQDIGADDLEDDGKLRKGKNIITAVKDGVLEYKLREGEGYVIAAAGDSGGPALDEKEGTILGVNSGGGCCDWGSVD